MDLPPMPEESRLQDPYMDGRDMRFEGYKIGTGEHAGEYPDTMPLVIEVIDAGGNNAAYVPDEQGWQGRRQFCHSPGAEGLRREARFGLLC
jgi:hypothetical protein